VIAFGNLPCPELTACVAAARKGQSEHDHWRNCWMNIFNILSVNGEYSSSEATGDPIAFGDVS